MGDTGKLIVVVEHGMYGCDTGCCGHYIEIDGDEVPGSFHFDHPGYKDDFREWATEFAKEWVESKFGEDHAFDLDWENCRISDD